MKNVISAILLSSLFIAVMSCGLVDKFTTGGQQMTKVDELWSDVPPMDGLTHSDLELPLTIKILMRTALNNLWRLNKEGEDKTPVNGDWIVFSSSGSPKDVQGFYTNSRMTSFGNNLSRSTPVGMGCASTPYGALPSSFVIGPSFGFAGAGSVLFELTAFKSAFFSSRK